MWDLWFFGLQSDKTGPYRLLHVWDLDTKNDRQAFSKAAKVMEKMSIIAVEKTPGLVLKEMNFSDNRAVFALAFDTLCSSLARGAQIQDIDRKHYGDSSYITFYDMILKDKKRSLAQATMTDMVA